MDPPSYGRGPGGEVWKLEDAVCDFVSLCEKVMSDDPPFMLINSYTTGLSALTMGYVLDIEIVKKHGGLYWIYFKHTRGPAYLIKEMWERRAIGTKYEKVQLSVF
jgi:hypothetical protein